MLLSVIIPVYNRPDEVRELLDSFTGQSFYDFEIIVIEDGSKVRCKQIVDSYAGRLPVRYLEKENGGPALARNFGAKAATGEYLLFLDSDTVLPSGYLANVAAFLQTTPVDLFGGPDMASPDFSHLQKAISYSMTSFFTTGGIRGGKKKLSRFIPRSFNMGVRRSVFEQVHGFSAMRFGEDMDLSMRILEAGHSSALVQSAALYHKRRTSLRGFYRQVFNSGRARIDLTLRHPGSLRLVHLLPSAFAVGCTALVLCALAFRKAWIAAPVGLYAILIFVHASIKEKSPYVGLLSIAAAFVQLYGYGFGLINNFFRRCIFKKDERCVIDNDRFYRN